MTDDEQSRLSDDKRKDNEQKKLWQELKVDFKLVSFKFPDNKIYGTVDIIPDSSRKLIKKLVLVVNKTNRIEFDSDYNTLAASGFNTTRKNPSAYIEAIPYNKTWSQEPKTSEICYFYFTGKLYTSSPTISFKWPKNNENSQANLVITWYHIGDDNAHRYIIYLDGVEVHNIRQKIIDDAFRVDISGFEADEKHTFQLVARLSNGRETYKSDLMEFVVPNKQSADNETIEFITVSEESPPSYLPIDMTKPEDFKPDKTEIVPESENQKEDNTTCSCCDHSPHIEFPGIEHYFRDIINKSSSSQKQISNQNKRTTKQDSDDDDDNDVIITNNHD